LKRTRTNSVLIVVATLAIWGLVGWMMLSLRASDEGPQLLVSTRLLGFLCVGAALLMLGTCIGVALQLSRLAVQVEVEQRFPPLRPAAIDLSALPLVQGEPAWMMAARLRDYAALCVGLGLLVTALGIGMAVPTMLRVRAPAPAAPAGFISVPALDRDLQSAPPVFPDRSTGAPG